LKVVQWRERKDVGSRRRRRTDASHPAVIFMHRDLRLRRKSFRVQMKRLLFEIQLLIYRLEARWIRKTSPYEPIGTSTKVSAFNVDVVLVREKEGN